MFFNKNTDKKIVMYSHNGISHSNKQGWATDTCDEMDYLRNRMKSEGSQAQERILFDFVYIIGKPIYKADRR